MKLTNILLTLAMALAIPSIGHSHGGHHDAPGKQKRLKNIALSHDSIRQLNNQGIIGLKRAIKNVTQLSKNEKLVKVTINGRAMGRMSDVSLTVDGYTVDSDYLRGKRKNRTADRHHRDRDHRRDHHRRDRDRLQTVVLTNQSNDSQGPWKLIIDRDVKVVSVVVSVRGQRRHGDHGHHHSQVKIGQFKVDKFVSDSKTLSVRLSNVTRLSLRSLGNSVDVQSVWVTYANGQTENLWELTGNLGENRTTSISINSRKRLRSITVQATSTGLYGSRATLVVSASTDRDQRGPGRRR